MPDVIFNIIPGQGGNVGLIILNRPQALNAISFDMLMTITTQLTKWADDPAIKAVCITANGDKAFSAGGDIKTVYQMGKAKHTQAYPFFYNEYQLNYFIKYYPKPYISFIHGITMGGGIGISTHGSHRVASNNLIWAMPETGIGFFTDIGATYFLSRCTGNLGIYLALTGTKLNLTEAMYCGFIDHYIAKSEFPTVISAIANINFNLDEIEHAKQLITDVLITYAKALPEELFSTATNSANTNHLLKHAAVINEVFARPTVASIIQALAEISRKTTKNHANSTWAQNTAKILATKSPTSLIVTLRALHTAQGLDFAQCMNMEYLLGKQFLASDDFYEGIRAAIIDKDNSPKWNPSSLAAASHQDLSAYFPLNQDPLNLKSV